MNTVQRTRGIRKAIQTILMNRPAQKYVTAGDSACRQMMREARRRHIPAPRGSMILSRAGYGLEFGIPDSCRQRRTA